MYRHELQGARLNHATHHAGIRCGSPSLPPRYQPLARYSCSCALRACSEGAWVSASQELHDPADRVPSWARFFWRKVLCEDSLDRCPIRSHEEGVSKGRARQAGQFRSNQLPVNGRAGSHLEGNRGDERYNARGPVAAEATINRSETLAARDRAASDTGVVPSASLKCALDAFVTLTNRAVSDPGCTARSMDQPTPFMCSKCGGLPRC